MRPLLYNLARLGGFPFGRGVGPLLRLKEDIESRGSLNFEITHSSDGWSAVCTDVPGIVTGGNDPNASQSQIDSMIKDAIFTAYGIPSYLCDDDLLESDDEMRNRINNRSALRFEFNSDLAYSL